MTIRGAGLVPLSVVMLSASIAFAQGTVGAAAPPAEQIPSAVPAPPPPPSRPADLPPKPPKVTCSGDMLTIAADNSTLDSILALVRGCTGARIDVPEGASKVRSFDQFGPGPVRAVLDELLSGTSYNYVIESSDQNPAKVEMVLLTARTGDVPGGANNSNSSSISTEIASTAGRRAWAHMQKFDKPDPNSEADMNAQSAAEAGFNGDSNTPAPAPAEPTDANAAQNAAPASAAPSDTEAPATAASAVPPASAMPAASLSPSAGGNGSIQDRINSMQQMFDQRRQMIQKQNGTPSQNAGPSN